VDPTSTENLFNLVHTQHDRLVSPMRELERDDFPSPLSATPLCVVGRGRVGRSLATAAERPEAIGRERVPS
jgi:hypothetical protein